jgi:hypothetical protein
MIDALVLVWCLSLGSAGIFTGRSTRTVSLISLTYTHTLMPRTSTSLPFGPVDCSDKVDVTGNHIFMDVENLLVDWPTYMVTFTPTHPGPVVSIRF